MMSPAADDALREEVRLLGGLLGEVIRAEGGEALFEHVEAVRQASVAYHRDPASHPAKRLEKLLTAMSVDQAAGLAHGFALFSLLANIAEDRATRRRAQHQAEAGARPDTPEGALLRLADQKIDKAAVRALLDEALISPVLTAHPSEVRRKSVIDRIAAVSALLDGCDQTELANAPEAMTDGLRRQTVILWATRLVRQAGLVVQDEIDTVVSFLDRVFLRVAPAQLADWRRRLDAPELAPFIRIGSWVGGDRDGNPNVDGEVLTAAFAAQARAVLDDIGADAIKTGMLGSTDVVERVAAILDSSDAPAVVDPVMIAKGGAALLADDAVAAVRSLMIPRAALLTPNAPEAGALTGLEVRDIDGQRRAGEALLNLGAKAVLMKGGHVDGPTVIDLLMTADGETVLEAERIDTRHTHGTGCTLASACAAGLALGRPLEVAVAAAWAYVGEAIRRAPGLGGGHGPLDHGWPVRG